MQHLWSTKPRIYYGFFGAFFGAVVLIVDPWHWPVLHTVWALRLLVGLALVSVVGMLHWKSGTPTCLALESYPFLGQEHRPNVMKDPFMRHQERGLRRSVWDEVNWAGGFALVMSLWHTVILRGDPPFPDVDASPPDTASWLKGASVAVAHRPGRAAYWDPWASRLVLGHNWDDAGWTGCHVVAHELAHADQPRGRLRVASGWIKGMLGVSVVLGLLAPAGWPMPLVAAGLVGLGDAGWRWPLEVQADRRAGERLVAELSDRTTYAAVRHWAQAITRRHRTALLAETVFWMAVAGVLVALMPILFFGRI